MRTLLLLILVCDCIVANAQSTVYRKIAQRRDQHIASTWNGVDSFRWSYNASASLIAQDALKADISGNWNNWFRYTYTLDVNERVTMQVRENWNGTAWVNNTRYTYTYDANGNLLTILYEVWNGTSWQETGKYEYTGYNTQHRYTQENTFMKSGGNWLNMTRKTIQYYPNQYQPQYIEEYSWDAGTSSWDSLKRYFYTFSLDSISSITTSIPSPVGWFLSTRYLASFTGMPLQKTSDYQQEWDTIPNPDVWQDKERNLYTYTPFDSIEQVQHELNSTFGWFPDARWNYVYNGSQRLAEKFSELNSGSWTNESRSTYAYTGNKVSMITDYTGLGSSWNLKQQTALNYAGFDSLIYKQVDTFDGAGFYPSKREFYYYNAYTVGVSSWQSAVGSICLFPNPAQQIISLSVESKKEFPVQMIVFDMTGRMRLLSTQALRNGNNLLRLDISSLPAGNYLFALREAHSGETVYTQQVSKLY